MCFCKKTNNSFGLHKWFTVRAKLKYLFSSQLGNDKTIFPVLCFGSSLWHAQISATLFCVQVKNKQRPKHLFFAFPTQSNFTVPLTTNANLYLCFNRLIALHFPSCFRPLWCTDFTSTAQVFLDDTTAAAGEAVSTSPPSTQSASESEAPATSGADSATSATATAPEPTTLAHSDVEQSTQVPSQTSDWTTTQLTQSVTQEDVATTDDAITETTPVTPTRAQAPSAFVSQQYAINSSLFAHLVTTKDPVPATTAADLGSDTMLLTTSQDQTRLDGERETRDGRTIREKGESSSTSITSCRYVAVLPSREISLPPIHRLALVEGELTMYAAYPKPRTRTAKNSVWPNFVSSVQISYLLCA